MRPAHTFLDGNRPDELLAVVDENDEETGAERRDVVHARGLLHRAVHVIVRSPEGRVLIQQRSALKDLFPLHWECVGGHLAPGEAYRDAAEREVGEELGIIATNLLFLGKLAACEATGMEFIEAYCAVAEAPLSPDSREVIATEWLTSEELRAEIAANTRLYSPTFLHTLRETRFLADV